MKPRALHSSVADSHPYLVHFIRPKTPLRHGSHIKIYNYLLKATPKPSKDAHSSLAVQTGIDANGFVHSPSRAVRPMLSKSILLSHGGTDGFVWPNDPRMPPGRYHAPCTCPAFPMGLIHFQDGQSISDVPVISDSRPCLS